MIEFVEATREAIGHILAHKAGGADDVPSGWKQPHDFACAWVMLVDGEPAAAAGLHEYFPLGVWAWFLLGDAGCPWLHRALQNMRIGIGYARQEGLRIYSSSPEGSRAALLCNLGFSCLGPMNDGSGQVLYGIG